MFNHFMENVNQTRSCRFEAPGLKKYSEGQHGSQKIKKIALVLDYVILFLYAL